MNLRGIQILLVTAGLVCGLTAAADPPWQDDSGSGYEHEHNWHKHKHWQRDRDEREDEDEDRDRGYHDRHGPPPWAPAYGYRRKHHRRDRDERVVIVNPPDSEEQRYDDRDSSAIEFRTASARIGINTGTCNRQVVGTVLGGIVGGVVGKNLAGHQDKQLVTVAGAIIGAMVGNQIGRNMDNADANCTNQALERAPDGQVVRWKNPDTGYHYAVTPYKTYQRDGHYCRDYTAVVAGSRTSKYRETACRNDKGVWQKM